MCREMGDAKYPSELGDGQKITNKRWRSKEEERHKRLLTKKTERDI
jgi:hypothetical protein